MADGLVADLGDELKQRQENTTISRRGARHHERQGGGLFLLNLCVIVDEDGMHRTSSLVFKVEGTGVIGIRLVKYDNHLMRAHDDRVKRLVFLHNLCIDHGRGRYRRHSSLLVKGRKPGSPSLFGDHRRRVQR